MGARVSVVVWIQNEDGPHEVHEEGHESAEDRAQRERGVSIGCGFFRREAQGREGNRGGVHGALRQRAEENGCVQETEGGRELISSHGGGLSCWRAGWAAEPWRAD